MPEKIIETYQALAAPAIPAPNASKQKPSHTHPQYRSTKSFFQTKFIIHNPYNIDVTIINTPNPILFVIKLLLLMWRQSPPAPKYRPWL
jgi:hypothetical protein